MVYNGNTSACSQPTRTVTKIAAFFVIDRSRRNQWAEVHKRKKSVLTSALCRSQHERNKWQEFYDQRPPQDEDKDGQIVQTTEEQQTQEN